MLIVILALIAAMLAYSVALDPAALQAISISLSWVYWFHTAGWVPTWFALVLDFFLVSIIVSWFMQLIRWLLRLWEAIPFVN